jgi:hypothetical protein
VVEVVEEEEAMEAALIGETGSKVEDSEGEKRHRYDLMIA